MMHVIWTKEKIAEAFQRMDLADCVGVELPADQYRELLEIAHASLQPTPDLRAAVEALEDAGNAIMCLLPMAKGYNASVKNQKTRETNAEMIQVCEDRRTIAEDIATTLKARMGDK